MKNKIIVSSEEEGMRLDRLLFQNFPDYSPSEIFRAIRSGEIRINSKRVQNFSRLQLGAIIRIPPQFISKKEGNEEVVKMTPPLIKHIPKIIYEDETVIVVDKPPHLAVHGGSGINWGLIEYLRYRYQQPKIELVHRLDRETSGVIIIARNRKSLRVLHQQFREKSVKKVYYARVFGRFPKKIRQISTSLFKRKSDDYTHKVITSKTGSPALTNIELIKSDEFSLLKVRPQSGKTHQIRVHLQSIGFPIIGDNRYANFDQNKEFVKKNKIKRMFLHAHSISIIHPVSNQKQEFCSQIPSEFTQNYIN